MRNKNTIQETRHSVTVVQGGFSKLKPMKDSDEQRFPHPFYRLTREYRQFVLDNGPYHFFISLTFGRNMRIELLCRHVNTLLDRYNQILFSRKYIRRRKFVQGFAFVERHGGMKAKCNYHFHLLIKCPNQYEKFTIEQHEDIFRKAAGRVTDERDRRVFNDKHIDITSCRDSGSGWYSTKEVNDGCICRIKFIGKRGLSDNE